MYNKANAADAKSRAADLQRTPRSDAELGASKKGLMDKT
jgi:hypothetical protein